MISPGHRRRLNRALHELRRPLQALTLLDDGVAPPPASPPGAARRGLLELASCALVELDGALNGGEPPAPGPRPVRCRELVLASLERWRRTEAAAGAIRLFWDAGGAVVEGDRVAIARAFDNLIANALEHGGPPLVVTGATVAGRLRVTVANGRSGDERGRERGASGSGGSDPRRGHGVGIVSEVASAHRGRFAICETSSGCVAALELPLADAGVAQAA